MPPERPSLENPDSPAEGPDLPPELVKAHFNFSDSTLAALPKAKQTVIG